MWLLDFAREWLTGDWNANKVADAIKIAIALICGGWAIYKSWKFAEGRLYERLIEYLKREEERLKSARSILTGAIAKQLPGKLSLKPIFSNTELNSALSHFKRGRVDRAETGLREVLSLADAKVGAARHHTKLHERQKAAAHLLLGAVADSKSQHAIAFDHFNTA